MRTIIRCRGVDYSVPVGSIGHGVGDQKFECVTRSTSDMYLQGRCLRYGLRLWPYQFSEIKNRGIIYGNGHQDRIGVHTGYSMW